MRQPKYHPLLCAGPVVRNILNGTQTQDRRPMKVQAAFEADDHQWIIQKGKHYRTGNIYTDQQDGSGLYPFPLSALPAPWQPGDILYVRETWRPWHENDADCGCGGDYCLCSTTPPTPVCYAADYHPAEWQDCDYVKWHPSIHMPFKYARIFLEVVSVRAERVQDISEEDAKAEGVEKGLCADGTVGFKNYLHKDALMSVYGLSARASFFSLWNSLYAKKPEHTWDANPWIWRTTFKRIEHNPHGVAV